MSEQAPPRHVRVEIAGIVQGVGFRPFLHRLAQRLHLTGWARNTPAGVELALAGEPESVEAFLHTVRTAPPPFRAVSLLLSQDRITAFGLAPTEMERVSAPLPV